MVSIIVPVYNASATVERCVESILTQTVSCKEIILVNDGSKDNSLEVIERYARQYENVVVVDKPNGGVSSARNIGLTHAKGEYIAFIDSDDYYTDETYIEQMRSCLQSHSECDLAVSGYTFIGNTGEHTISPPDGIETIKAVVEKFQGFRDKGFLNSPCNKLFKRALIKEAFSTAMTFGEDAVFVYHYLKNCRSIAFCQGGGYGYENRIPSSTAVYRKELMYDKKQTNQYYAAIAELLFVVLEKEAALKQYVSMRAQSIITIAKRILSVSNFVGFLRFDLRDVLLDDVFQQYSNDIAVLKKESSEYEIAFSALRKKQFKIKCMVIKSMIKDKIKNVRKCKIEEAT